MKLRFSIETELGKARAGVVRVRGKKFKTPVFLPVATLASVRALDSRDLKKLKVEALIANTFHLHLKPGEELINKLGGLHNFMNYNGTIFTDSGGFQAFSLGFGMEHGVGKIANNIFPGDEMKEEPKVGERWAKVDDEGITYRNPITGEKMRLTPELSMKIQSKLGSDVVYVLDECTSPLSSKEYTSLALERTHRWALECLEAYDKKQAIFGIVQGGAYKDLRVKSARFIASLPFDGFGIGGSLGKTKQDMHNILEWVIPLLPAEKPRHLLGIGAVEDLFNCVERGIDVFDCVTPTRWARRGMIFISPFSGGTVGNKFRIKIGNASFRLEKTRPDDWCDCFVCQDYTRAYLHHLYRNEKLSFFRLASYHNLHFILKLMREIRESIIDGSFHELKQKWLGKS